MRNWLFSCFFILSCAFVGLKGLQAQSIPVSADEIAALTKQYDTAAYMVMSGARHYSNFPEDKPVKLGRLATLPLIYTTYRLLDRGELDIDQPIMDMLPQYDLEDINFITVTVRHLLAETGGFAVPPWLTVEGQKKLIGRNIELNKHHDPLPYVKRLRSSGEMTHQDVIGWFLLAQILEKVSGKDILNLIDNEVAKPLGLPTGTFYTLPPSADNNGLGATPPFLAPIMALETSTDGLAALMQALTNNEQFDGKSYLSQRARISLVRDQTWHLHPMGPGRTLGLATSWHDGRRLLSINQLNCINAQGLAPYQLVYFPTADLVVVSKTPCDAGAENLFLNAIAKRFIPPKSQKDIRAKAAALRLPNKLGGLYIKDTAPSAWLALRLDALKSDVINLRQTPEDLFVENSGIIEAHFKKITNLAYETPTGEKLYISEAYGGGNLYYRGEYYRYIGLLGDKDILITPVVWLLALLFSGSIYAFSKRDKSWRRMGQFCALGPILFSVGVALELTYWPEIWLAGDGYWAVTAWRITWNIGLMMVLSVVMFTLSFARSNNMPSGYYLLPASVHVTLLAGTATAIILISVAWGIAGTFFPG